MYSDMTIYLPMLIE